MQTFQGLAVSDGLTVGPVVRIDRGAAGPHRIVCDPVRGRALYEAALLLAKKGGQDADILMFQIALLEDESFTNEIGDYIAAGAGSAAAVERAEQIFAVIDARCRSNLPTIVTTNLTPQEMDAPETMQYKRIFDRVAEMCPVSLLIDGESRRIQNAQRRKEIARELLL